MRTREELAWAAGLYEGEGSIHFNRTKKNKGGYLRLSVVQNDREVLDRFKEAIGLGKVYGPYMMRGKHVYYQYIVAGHEKCQATIAMLWAWLGSVKKEQARKHLCP